MMNIILVVGAGIGTFLLILFLLYGRGSTSSIGGNMSFRIPALHWMDFWKFLLGCVGLMLVIVLVEELFFDRDYRPERVTLPIGYERYIEETVRDGQESAIYLIPRASGNRWWQSCFEDLNGNQLPDEVIVPVNQRVVNGRTVADGVMIRNNTGGLVSFRAWRVRNNRHGPTRC